MRKPAHANPGATLFAVKVFEKGARNAILEAQGIDPSHLAKQAAEHRNIRPPERRKLRAGLRASLKALQENSIPNMTDLQLEIDGRRVRVRAAS